MDDNNRKTRKEEIRKIQTEKEGKIKETYSIDYKNRNSKDKDKKKQHTDKETDTHHKTLHARPQPVYA